MKALSKEAVEKMIEHANDGQLDELTGDMVRLNEEQLAELKALVWLAKDDENPKHWEALVIEAKFQLDDQTARFIADTPELGSKLQSGLDKMESAGRI
ncbi:MAG: DUF3775 domain-containing protein [Gammaproteobacteria bacterium]|nr:DUF3775 domain-containing protein [Gammaproteobacteria bacterium]